MRRYPTPGPGKIMALAAYGQSNPAIQGMVLALLSPTTANNLKTRGFSPFNHGEYLSDSKQKRSQDIAWALQNYTNSMLTGYFNNSFTLCEQIGIKSENICFSGGVALNCIANSVAFHNSPFKNLYVPPCANDSGLAIGFGLAVYYLETGAKRVPGVFSPFTGPRYSREAIKSAVDSAVANHPWLTVETVDEERVAELIVGSDIVAMWRNGSECGPRALGHRSLLARTDIPNIRERLNSIKKREWYRPFAPIILEEAAGYILEDHIPGSRYMTTSAKISPPWHDRLSGVCHVDKTTRPEIINRDFEPYIYDLISNVAKKTGIPAILNTSFNLAEPIVETPADAIRTFMRLDIRYLVLDDILITKHGAIEV